MHMCPQHPASMPHQTYKNIRIVLAHMNLLVAQANGQASAPATMPGAAAAQPDTEAGLSAAKEEVQPVVQVTSSTDAAGGDTVKVRLVHVADSAWQQPSSAAKHDKIDQALLAQHARQPQIDSDESGA